MIGTRRITRRSFLAAAGLAAVGASLSLTGCSGSVSDGLSSKHLLVAHSHSEAHPVNVGLQKMTEVASAESDLTFSVYPNGQLGDNAAMIQLVKAGVLDIARSLLPAWSSSTAHTPSSRCRMCSRAPSSILPL